MKTIKYITAFFLLGLQVQCTDVEEEAFAFISPDSFYSSEDDLNKALTGVYDRFQETYGGDAVINYFLPLESLTEFGAPNRTENGPHLYNVWFGANDPNSTIDKWQQNYDIINTANVVLGRGEGVEMDETAKARIFGQARFLRALSYYFLVRLYGGVPVPETFTQGTEGLEIPRKSADEVYEYIISDLEYAAGNLPEKSEYPADEVWRVSKGAALAFLGDVYLTRGSMTGDLEYFQQSKNYSGQVIESGEYELEPDFRDLWVWYNPGNKNGMESVFEIQHGHMGGENNDQMHLYTGINIGVADPAIGKFMYHRYGPSFYAYNSYGEDDYRKSSTFLTEVTLSNGSHYQWVEADKGFYPGSAGWQSSTPGNIKFYDRSQTAYAAADVYVMRYAEILLNYAEAENALNGPTADAYEKINMVRERAQLDDLSGLSKTQFDDAVYRERGWEFIGEGKLYYDGIRTGKITEAVKAEVAYGNAQGLFLYTPLQFAPTKNFLWKIPVYDLSANPALEQNPDNENAL